MCNTKKSFPFFSFLVLKWDKKKGWRRVVEVMLDSGSSVSCSLYGALWKHFSQGWIIHQRNFIACTHKLHLCNQLMLLKFQKKRGNGVCAVCDDFLMISLGAHY